MNDSPVIISNTGSGDADNLRARDVDFMLKGVDVHPTIKRVLCAVAERNHQTMKAVAELAVMFDKMIDNMQQFSEVAQNMKQMTDRYLRDRVTENEKVPE